MGLGHGGIASDLKRNGLLAVASGLLGALIFYPFDLWFLAPVALVPLLIALRRTQTLRAAGYLALLCGWTMAMASVAWLWSIFSSGMIAVCALIALPWLLLGLATRHLAARTSPGMMVALTPILFTAMEWVRCQGWYFRFSWLQPGTAYVASQAGQSTYPLVGIYGMTFLSVLVSAALAAALVQPDSRRRIQGLAATAALVVVLALAFRLAWVSGVGRKTPDTLPVPVLMVQNETEDMDWLVEHTRLHARSRPALVIWPELAVNGYPEDDPVTLARLRDLAREMQAALVVGCKSHVPAGTRTDWLRHRAMMQSEGALYYNSALVLGPDGQTIGRYHKRHPIQFFSDGVPGPDCPVFTVPLPAPHGEARLGVAICYDLDFADSALNLTRNGAEFLVVPTYDARDWGPVQQMQHARLALARAAEVGRCIVRPTSSGVSQIIATGGEQLRLIPSGDAGHMLGVTDRSNYRTPYVRVTWLLPHLCLVLSVLALILCRSRTRA